MISQKKIVLSALAATIVAFTGCGGSDGGSSTPAAATPNCDASVIDVVLSGTLSTQELNASKVYGLDGKVIVGSGATLTIPAGTTIAGCTGSSFMLVAAGADINATGTLADPIVFTSQANLKGSPDGTAGEWGGLTILGNAYTYNGVVTYEASSESFGAADTTNDGESSGVLKYVVIKNSGYEVETDKELNGLSLAGVGSGTVIEDIAIIGGLDDGIEFWGGAVNVTGLYVKGAQDDSIDTDLGYNGTITNAYVVQTTVDKTNAYDSAAVETGNDTDQVHTGFIRYTKPTIVNLTATVTGAGIYMKNDAGIVLDNALFTSTKVTDTQMVAYRTDDVMAIADVNVTNVSMDNGLTADAEYFLGTNTKTGTNTALVDYTNAGSGSDLTGITINDTSATGATAANIWKGNAGDNNDL